MAANPEFHALDRLGWSGRSDRKLYDAGFAVSPIDRHNG